MMGSIKMVGPAPVAQRWDTFVSGNVVLADVNSTQNIPHSNYTSSGVTVGADYRIDERWTAGGLLAYNHTDADLDSQGSNAKIDSFSPGIYGAYSNNGWYANGLFTYGYNSYESNRTIIIPGINRTANGTPDGDQYSGGLTTGYDFHVGNLTIGPVAGVNYVRLNIHSFDETGAGAANLFVEEQTADSLRSRLGFNSTLNTKYYDTTFTWRFGAQWQHEFMDNSNGITSSFQIPNTTPFTVVGNDPSRESALVNVGVSADINRNMSVFTDYSVQAGQSNYFGQSVQAGLRIGF
jgi:outer membrane autotransporter protein